MREERWARADSLIRRKFGTVPFGDQVLFAAMRRDTAADRALRSQALEVAGQKGRRTADLALETGWLLATYLEDLERAETYTRFGTAASLASGLQASAHRQLGNLAVAGGRWSVADTEFAAAGRIANADSALIGRALAAALPFLAVPSPRLQALRAEVERWEPGRDVTAPLPASLQPLTGHLRLYLLGLLSARLGDSPRAIGYAAELERLAAPAEARALVQDLGRTIRAQAAAESGRTEEALAQLEMVKGEVPLELIRLPYFSGEQARYLRGLLLHRAGRDEESLRLMEVGFTGTPNELLYRAPGHLLRAELYRRRNQREAAAQEYTRFLQLWASCDPALRPAVDNARAELAAVTAEPR